MTIKISVLGVWEQLGSLQGWSELAAESNASPFCWPSISLPWWFEMGTGRLMSIAVQEAGLLVGLALVYDGAGTLGHHRIRFLYDGVGTYHQLLIADGRDDIAALIFERMLALGVEINLCSIPANDAKRYGRVSSDLSIGDDLGANGFVATVADDATTGQRSVREISDPAECVQLLTSPTSGHLWDGGAAGSRMAAFFASAVDASARVGRLTLHLADGDKDAPSGVLVIHGSSTSVVWRHVGRLVPALVQSVTSVATAHGSLRTLWPVSAGVSGEVVPLLSVTRQGHHRRGLGRNEH